VAYVLELRRSCTLLCGVQYLCSGFFCQVSVLNSTIGDDSWDCCKQDITECKSLSTF